MKAEAFCFVCYVFFLLSGGPKLRKWYGAPKLVPKDETSSGDDDEFEGIYNQTARN